MINLKNYRQNLLKQRRIVKQWSDGKNTFLVEDIQKQIDTLDRTIRKSIEKAYGVNVDQPVRSLLKKYDLRVQITEKDS